MDAEGAVERTLVDVGSAELEVFTGGPMNPAVPMICAAHPAEAFNGATVGLLAAAAGARVMCINLRGIGASVTTGKQNVTLESMVEDLDAARQRIGLGPWVFWGLSGGGWLAEIYGRRHPEGVAGLIVESCCLCFRERLADPHCSLSPFHPQWREKLEAAKLLDPNSHASPETTGLEWLELPDVGLVLRRRGGPALLVTAGALSAEMRKVMPTLWGVDARKWWKHVRVPTLVLTGGADPLLPLSHAKAVADQHPGSTFVAIEKAGHAPSATRHPEAIAAVRAFLDRLGKRR